MQVKTTNKSNTEFLVSVSADQKLMDEVKQKVLRHLGAKHVKLPGFRNGKAPLSLIEKNVDQDLLQSEFLEEAVNRLYINAILSEKLKPISQPKITLKKFVPFTQLEFDAEIEGVGDIKLVNYKSIKLAKPKVSISDKDVNEVLESLKARMAERQESDNPAQEGDEVVIDFKGIDSKKIPVSGADGKDYPIIIGSKTFIPGFEPKLVGMKSGDEKTFDVTFPKDYGVSALQGKKVTFTVNVKKVSNMTEPKLNDDFAAKAGPFKTLAELKKDIKNQLAIERQTQADRDYENELVKKIADKSSLSIPKSLVSDQVLRMEQSEKQNLAYRGETWQEHLAQEGVTEEEHRKRNEPDAEQNVKAGLIISEIADREKLTVTPDELEIRIQLLKGQYKDSQMQAELDKPENRRDIESRILTEKTVAKIAQYAQS